MTDCVKFHGARIDRRPPAAQKREGALLTIEMLFVLPLVLYTGLIIVQAILIHTAYQRVQTAATAAAELASCGLPHEAVHQEAGRVLGFLGCDYETEYEIVDLNGNGQPDNCVDVACVGVRIPMGAASINYLGLLGGNVKKLHIRSVVCKQLRECEGCEPGPRFCAGLILQIINQIEAIRDERPPRINQGNANSLITKLQGALEVLCSQCFDDPQEACNKIQAFINELDTFEPGVPGKGKDLTADELNEMFAKACEAIECICEDRECIPIVKEDP
jgi:hypothetical protein